MSGYDSIPPERQAAYLQNAQEAIEAATEPVVHPAVEALGELVTKEAESLTDADAKGNQVADRAKHFLASQAPIGDQAAKYLEINEQLIKAQVDEITDKKLERPTKIAEKPGKNNSMTTRRDLGGTGFGEVHKLTGQIGLKNQLWTKMTEQNKQDPEKPQAPSS